MYIFILMWERNKVGAYMCNMYVLRKNVCSDKIDEQVALCRNSSLGKFTLPCDILFCII